MLYLKRRRASSENAPNLFQSEVQMNIRKEASHDLSILIRNYNNQELYPRKNTDGVHPESKL